MPYVLEVVTAAIPMHISLSGSPTRSMHTAKGSGVPGKVTTSLVSRVASRLSLHRAVVSVWLQSMERRQSIREYPVEGS